MADETNEIDIHHDEPLKVKRQDFQADLATLDPADQMSVLKEMGALVRSLMLKKTRES